MLKLFQKYLDLSAPSSRHLHSKLEACKDVEEGFKVLSEAGWYISAPLANAIRADKSTSKDLEKELKDKEAEELRIAELKAEEERVKREAEDEGKKAKLSQNHESIENAF